MLYCDCDDVLMLAPNPSMRNYGKSLHSHTYTRSLQSFIHFPDSILVTIFKKLSREDIERLSLVSLQFYDIIHGKEFEEERGPLRALYELNIFLDTECGTPGRVEYYIQPSRESESHKDIVWLTDADSLLARMSYAAVKHMR